MAATSAGAIGIDLAVNSGRFLADVERAGVRASRLATKMASGTALSINDIFGRTNRAVFGRVISGFSRMTEGLTSQTRGLADTLSEAYGGGAARQAAAEAAAGITRELERASAASDKLTSKAARIGTSMDSSKKRVRDLYSELEMLNRDQAAIRQQLTSAMANGNKALADSLRVYLAQNDDAIAKATVKYDAARARLSQQAKAYGVMKAEAVQADAAVQKLNADLAAQNAIVASKPGLFARFATMVGGLADKFLFLIKTTLGVTAALAGIGAAIAISMAGAKEPIAEMEGLRGSLDRLKQSASAFSAIFKSVMASAFISVAQTVVNVASQIIGAINAVLMKIGGLIDLATGGRFSRILAQTVDQAANSTNNLAKSQGGATKAAKAQNKAQKDLNRTLAGFDKINKLTSQKDNLGAGGGGGASAGVDSLGFGTAIEDAKIAAEQIELPPRLVASFEKLRKAVGDFISVIGQGLKWVWDNVIVPFRDWLMESVAPPALDIIAASFRMLTVVLRTLGDAFVKYVWNPFLKPLATVLGEAISGALELIAKGFEKVAGWAEDHPRLFTAIATAIGILVAKGPLISGLTKILGGLFTLITAHPIAALVTAIALAVGYVYTNWDKIKKTKIGQAITSFWNNILKPFLSLIGDGLGWLWDRLQELWEKVGPFFEGIGDFLGGVGEKIGELFGNKKTERGMKRDERNYRSYSNVLAKSIGNPRLLDRGIQSFNKYGKAAEGAKDKLGTFNKWWQNKFGTGKDGRLSLTLNAKDETAQGIASAKNRLNQYPAKKDTQLGYQFTGTEATWKSQWSTRVSKSFYNVTGNSAAKVGYQYNGSESNWKNDWNNRVNRSFAGKTVSLGVTPYLTKTSVSYTSTKGMSQFVGNLRFYANGGWVARNTPQLAVIGDNPREGEIVSPESKFQTMLDKASAQGGNMATVEALLRELIVAVRSTDTDVYLDSEAITKSVVNNINRQTQATGRSPVIV